MTLQEQIDALPAIPITPPDDASLDDWYQHSHAWIDWYSARLALAREWIEAGSHRHSCGVMTMLHGTPCTCGRDALLKVLEVPK